MNTVNCAYRIVGNLCEKFAKEGFSSNVYGAPQKNNHDNRYLCNIIGFKTCEDLMEKGILKMETVSQPLPITQEPLPSTPVPEPGAAFLFGAGVVIATLWSKKMHG